jgi:hypothetical protein
MRLWPFARFSGGDDPPGSGGARAPRHRASRATSQGPTVDEGWWTVPPIVPVATRAPLPVAAPLLTTPHVAGTRQLVPLTAAPGLPPVDGSSPAATEDAAAYVTSDLLRDDLPTGEGRDRTVPFDDDAVPTRMGSETVAPPEPEVPAAGQDLAGVIAMLDAQVARGRQGAGPAPPSFRRLP